MSEAPEAEVVETAELARTGTKWGTIVGRVMLAFLVVLLAIEASAKFGYDKTLTSLRANASKVMGDAIKGGQPELEEWSLPLADAEKCVSGFPSQKRQKVLGASVVVLRWLSLFKTYIVQLQLDDENTVIALSTDELD